MARSKTIAPEVSGAEVVDHAFASPVDRDRVLDYAKKAGIAFAVLWAVGSCTVTAFGGDDAPTALPGNSDIVASDIVGGFATNFVQDYLESSQGSQRDLARYISMEDTSALPASPNQFSDARIAFRKQRVIVDSNLSLWSVIISGRLNPQSSQNVDRTYWQVPISLFRNAPRAILPPREVKDVGLGADMTLAYRETVPDASQVHETVAGFVRSFLTGGVDMALYTVADSNVAAISPKPFETVQFGKESIKANGIPDESDGSEIGILAFATARTKSGVQVQMPYTLTLQRVSGRWLVKSLDDLPYLDSSGGTSPSSAGPTNSTTQTAPPATRNN